MKYFSCESVVEAYKGFRKSMTNKSWGYLALLKECDECISPTIPYRVNLDNVSNFLEGIFNLSRTKKTYNGGKSLYVVFSKKWSEFFVEQGSGTPNIFDVIVWAFRRNAFEDSVDESQLVSMFASSFNISIDVLNACFDMSQKTINFTDPLYSEAILKAELSKLGVNMISDNIDSQGNSVVANPGEISRGPFIQPLYTGLEITDYVMILQSDYSAIYGNNKSSSSLTKSYTLDELVRCYRDLVTSSYSTAGNAIFMVSYGNAVKQLNLSATDIINRAMALYPNDSKKKFRSQELNQAFKLYDYFILHPDQMHLPGLAAKHISIISSLTQPLQQIFYGAPGTGKSQTIKDLTVCRSVIRTTFHPDSDYSTFVGAYKPIMEYEDVRVVPVVLNTGASFNQNEGTYTKKRISYRFVKQAFLKAYLGAWKKYADSCLCASSPLTFTNKHGEEYTILSVDSTSVKTRKVEIISKSTLIKNWNCKTSWKNGTFQPNRNTGNHIAKKICEYIYSNNPTFTQSDGEKAWDWLIRQIKESGLQIKGQQLYDVSVLDDDQLKIIFEPSAKKERMSYMYENNSTSSDDNAEDGNIREGIVRILKDFGKGSFESAWEELSRRVAISLEPQFLIIEEINRGNCAQIFGDLFQLLDRQDNGFSTYPIEPDSDLQKEIENAFKNDPDYSIQSLNVDCVVNDYTSNYRHQDNTPCTLSEDILTGRIMLLPNNLYIWATMNTSDQSLFPIDSAFKRRWEWKYIKIKDGVDKAGTKLDWKIKVKGQQINGHDDLSWWEFLKKINEIIASMTSSADKQLGYFFCKANQNGEIDAETLVSKVMFYLWNDVFKDTCFEDASLFQYDGTINGKTEKRELTFPDFYDEDGENVNTDRLVDFIERVMAWQKQSDAVQ